ncbi:MAG: hypothetical protein WA869_21705 [Alloacidobacterium sp.]|jgi:hypothetical protein
MQTCTTAISRDIPSKAPKSQDPTNSEFDVQAEADRLVLKSHTPVGVVINSARKWFSSGNERLRTWNLRLVDPA